jgi:alcohol dehydrogenase class IV
MCLQTDVIKKVENVLKEKNAYGATFSEIGEHAPVAGIRSGIKAFKDAGADIIVSVGGGSPVDASKAIIYMLQEETGGPYARQIAIPTTLSAAEYTIGAGFTNDNGVKTAVSSQELAPAGIILDAELTLSTPERLWLSTGMRALDHAVGEYVAFAVISLFTEDIRESVSSSRSSSGQVFVLRCLGRFVQVPTRIKGESQFPRNPPKASAGFLDESLAAQA